MSIEDYLAGNRCFKIKVGQSGADVYDINGNMILKHVERRKLEDSLFDTYTREASLEEHHAPSGRWSLSGGWKTGSGPSGDYEFRALRGFQELLSCKRKSR